MFLSAGIDMLNKQSTVISSLIVLIATFLVPCSGASENNDIALKSHSTVEQKILFLKQENKKLWVQRNIQRKHIDELTKKVDTILERLEATKVDRSDKDSVAAISKKIAEQSILTNELGKQLTSASQSQDVRIEKLSKSLEEIKVALKQEADSARSANKAIAGTRAIVEKQAMGLRELEKKIESADNQISELAKDVSNKNKNLKHANTGDVDTIISDNRLTQKVVVHAIALLVILAFIGLSFLIIYRSLGKRIADTRKLTEDLKNKNNLWNEEILKQLKQECTQIDEILKHLLDKAENIKEQDHSLVKALADRIAFMQMTLFRMDSGVRGHRQLSKAIRQMLDTLLVNGYEIIDMLGQPYHEGMKSIVNFVDDENLKDGEQIITGVIKPQINYRGTMIQTAQITVSQNI